MCKKEERERENESARLLSIKGREWSYILVSDMNFSYRAFSLERPSSYMKWRCKKCALTTSSDQV